MRGFRAPVGAALAAAAVLLLLVPGVTTGASPGPTEPCVPGTVWEDPSSGVKYLCVYDELYGGSRWELISSNQAGTQAFTYRSSVSGCTFLTVGLSRASGGGGDALIRSFRPPCATVADRSYQPPGEIRVRVVLQRYGSSWTTCRDTGYGYNAVNAWTLIGGIGMGSAPDCGAGPYRTWGTGQVYQGGAWHGSSLLSPALWLD